MKIIIIGCGQVGTTLTAQLSAEKHDITVIDTDAQKIRKITEDYDIMGLCGNGVQIGTLNEADIKNTDILIAVTESDEINLLCCIMAKKASKCYTVARVRNPVYSGETDFIKAQLGLSMIINPELLTATEISQLIKFPSAEQIDSFADGKIHLVKIKIHTSSPLANIEIKDIAPKTNCEILACAIERGDDVLIPDGSTEIKVGDTLSFIAFDDKIQDVFKKLGMHRNAVKNTMIVGGDTTAFYLSRLLCKAGIKVKIIEDDAGICNRLSDQFPDVTVIQGDGTDKKLLIEEGISAADAFVALTHIDEENIFLSLFAKQSSEAKPVAKVNRLEFDSVINGLDMGSIVFPKYITADYIMQFVRARQNSQGNNISTLYRILDNKVEALEFTVHDDSPVVNKPIMNLNLKPNVLICCISRSGNVIIPGGRDCIEKGDKVIIVSLYRGLHDLQDILED